MLYFLKTKLFFATREKIRRFVADEFPFIAALPAIIWQIFFSLIPIVAMLIYSFIGNENTNNFLGIFTIDFYLKVTKTPFFKAIYNSLILAVGSIFGCLIFSFPTAYLIAFKIYKRFQPLAIILMMLPLWTNFIIRIYSWFFLLDKRGIFSVILLNLGIIQQSTQFLFSPWVTIIGMIYCYYPFMLLPIYLSMSEIKNELIEASADLGANNWQTLRFLIIPSCLGDMIYSSIMIGLMAFGEFAIPELLGGAKYSFWGSIIASKFTLLRDFKSGAAYTFVGTVIVLALSGFIYSVTVLFKSLLSSGFKEGFKDK